MRRSLLFAIAALSIVAAVTPGVAAGKGAVPARSHAYGASLLTWQERWIQWAFGSSTNPLMSDTCGEKVGRLFFLTATTQPGVTEVDCHIRPGTPLLVTPGGNAVWAPTNGQTRAELLASRDSMLSALADPHAALDGHSLGNLDDTLRLSDVYAIGLEPGNFIQAVDPAVLGTETQVASNGWFVRLHPLTPGHHEFVLSDRINGDLFEIVFHISVR